jgi:hypothetical protein
MFIFLEYNMEENVTNNLSVYIENLLNKYEITFDKTNPYEWSCINEFNIIIKDWSNYGKMIYFSPKTGDKISYMLRYDDLEKYFLTRTLTCYSVLKTFKNLVKQYTQVVYIQNTENIELDIVNLDPDEFEDAALDDLLDIIEDDLDDL